MVGQTGGLKPSLATASVLRAFVFTSMFGHGEPETGAIDLALVLALAPSVNLLHVVSVVRSFQIPRK